MPRFISIIFNAVIAALCIFSIANGDADKSKWYFAFQGAIAMWCIYDFVKDVYRASFGIR